MSNFIYELSPTFTLGLVVLAFMFRIYKRSISTFVIIMLSAIVTNLNNLGYQDYSTTLVFLTIPMLLMRAIMKPETDSIIQKPFCGIEKRNKRRI